MFFVITPIQYWLVGISWYGLFAIFIPVYAFLFIPLRGVLSGDYEHFLEQGGDGAMGAHDLRLLCRAMLPAPA